jgi:hypothetical protein
VLPAGVPALPGRQRLTSPATSVSRKILAEEHLEDGEGLPDGSRGHEIPGPEPGAPPRSSSAGSGGRARDRNPCKSGTGFRFIGMG